MKKTSQAKRELHLKIVLEYIEGRNGGYTCLSKKYGIPKSQLRYWVKLYKEGGKEWILRKPQKYSGDFKVNAVEYMKKNSLPLAQTAAHFGLTCTHTLRTWEQEYDKYGREILLQKSRGIIAKMKRPQKTLSPANNLECPWEMFSMTEVEFLQMENSILKNGEFEEIRSGNAFSKSKTAEEYRHTFPLNTILWFLHLPRSTYYACRKKYNRQDKYADTKTLIREIYSENKGIYGYRRITAALKNKCITINSKVVRKLMKQLGLKGVRRKRRKYNSYKGEIGKIVPNLINRNFHDDNPGEKWTTDVTQFNVFEKKLYLSPILDLYNGEIISYNLSVSPDLKQILDMVDRAKTRVKGKTNLIFHSDQGWQYQHKHYQNKLKQLGIQQSMSRKGNCLDNSPMENFFGILKNEMYYGHKFTSIEELKKAIDEYINYCNNYRIKTKLGGLSPIQYRIKNKNFV